MRLASSARWTYIGRDPATGEVIGSFAGYLRKGIGTLGTDRRFRLFVYAQ